MHLQFHGIRFCLNIRSSNMNSLEQVKYGGICLVPYIEVLILVFKPISRMRRHNRRAKKNQATQVAVDACNCTARLAMAGGAGTVPKQCHHWDLSRCPAARDEPVPVIQDGGSSLGVWKSSWEMLLLSHRPLDVVEGHRPHRAAYCCQLTLDQFIVGVLGGSVFRRPGRQLAGGVNARWWRPAACQVPQRLQEKKEIINMRW